MDQQFSKNALLTFLETVVRQGLVNSNTAAGWKAAFSRILEDVPDQEDVRKIDVPTAIKRYHNKHPGELKPTSLKEYERRLVVLVDAGVDRSSGEVGGSERGRRRQHQGADRYVDAAAVRAE